MPLLFPKVRVTQVFGANTEVGKTLLTTSLLRSTAKLYKKQSQDDPSLKKKVWYLKPVSTGPMSESDVAFVDRHAGAQKDVIETTNLYQYKEPVSPHLARMLAPELDYPPTNDHLVDRIRRYIEERANLDPMSAGSIYLETAGGVHSPSLHFPMTQLDSLRPLRLPTLLVAAPQLGGISTTLSAYESLLLRGFTIDGVLGLRDEYYKNHEFLKPYFEERGIGFWSFDMPHSKAHLTPEQDHQKLQEWYEKIETVGAQKDGDSMEQVVAALEKQHEQRVAELESMPRRTLDSVWWPFTQHGMVNKESDVMVIDSAKGDTFDAYYKPSESTEPDSSSLLNPLFDGSASWFTQAHHHANPRLTLAAASAAGRYGHVLFPSGTHAPALDLAETLLKTVGQGWASRVFYSDNGSTGIEVGLKMALRSAGKRYGWDGVVGGDAGVIGLKGGYHGDTIGSMDASDQGIYNTAVDWYKGRGIWFSPPEVKIQNGQVIVQSTGHKQDWPSHPMKGALTPTIKDESASAPLWQVPFDSLHQAYDVESRIASPLADYYRAHIRSTLERVTAQVDPATGNKRKFGAVVLEPICLGAGGMVFVDPLFQRCLVDVVRESQDLFVQGQVPQPADESSWKGLPVIFDEVFSGLCRMSYLNASKVLGVAPDIAVYAKILSGGLLPLSATLASNSIFESFLHPTKKVDALLHGHSYTANPIGCNVALEALKMVQEQIDQSENGQGVWNGPRKSWGLTSKSESESSTIQAPILWSFWDKDFLYRISRLDRVQGVMALGTVLSIELREQAAEGYGGYASSAGLDFLTSLRKSAPVETPTQDSTPFAPFHLHSRPLGNVVYVMTSLFTERQVVEGLEKSIEKKLQEGW